VGAHEAVLRCDRVTRVAALLINLEPEQDALLGEILDAELVTVRDLTQAGVFPVLAKHRPPPEKPPKQQQL
jgi:hypothetical protein